MRALNKPWARASTFALFIRELLDGGAMPLDILESKVDRWLGELH